MKNQLTEKQKKSLKLAFCSIKHDIQLIEELSDQNDGINQELIKKAEEIEANVDSGEISEDDASKLILEFIEVLDQKVEDVTKNTFKPGGIDFESPVLECSKWNQSKKI